MNDEQRKIDALNADLDRLLDDINAAWIKFERVMDTTGSDSERTRAALEVYHSACGRLVAHASGARRLGYRWGR